MRTRPPFAWTAGVLVLHIALLLTLRHQGAWSRNAIGKAVGAPRLVLLDAASVAALTTQRAAAGDARTRPSPPAASGAAPPDAGPPAAQAPQAAVPTTPQSGLAIYRPQSTLEAPVRFRSAPDISRLDGLPWSGIPLRVRLFIDAKGTVVDVQFLHSAEQDVLLQGVREMFLATGFTPGVQNGQPVPCYKDIEMNVGNPS